MAIPADQAAQEIESKLAARFGGSPHEPAPAVEAPEGLPQGDLPEAQDDAAELAEIEWGGEKYRLPPQLKDAFEKANDYLRKTTELAEQRRTLDHSREILTSTQVRGEFEKSIADENRELAVIDAYLQQAAKLNWTGMSTDQMLRQRMEVDQVRDRREQLMKAVEEKRGKFQTEMNERLSTLRARARELATKSIPNFSEETEKGIKHYAMSEGLSEAEVDSVLLDPRSAKILWKASQYDKVKAGTVKAVDAAKAVRPGAASEKMPQEVRARFDYQKAVAKAKNSGEKASLIEDRLAASPLFRRK